MAATSVSKALPVPLPSSDMATNAYEAFVAAKTSGADNATLANIWKKASSTQRQDIENDFPGSQEELATGGRKRRKTKKTKNGKRKAKKTTTRRR